MAAGSVFVAVLASLALAATVFVAHRALGDASAFVVRGEGDALVAAVAADLPDPAPLASDVRVAEVLEHHKSKGLRYLALVHRGRAQVATGTSLVPASSMEPGSLVVRGSRARLVATIPPPKLRLPWLGGADAPPFPPFPEPPPSPLAFPPPGPPPGPPLLILEFEPPVIAKLRTELDHISIVATAAGLVLLAFALAWSHSALRLAAIERRAERERRLVALGQMASVMAHELRNPLASLKGNAQLLVEAALVEPRVLAKAERIVGEAERLERLTTNLLEFVRDAPLDPRPVTPSEVLLHALEGLDAERVRIEISQAPPTISVDPPRTARALHNLVQNALQASVETTAPVEVRVAVRDPRVVFVVRDHGPGLPAPSEVSIFEPFVTTRVKGTGLGLPIALRIAEQQGGTLQGETHPEGGAVFTLELPLVVSSL